MARKQPQDEVDFIDDVELPEAGDFEDFNFGKSLDQIEKEALIPKGEYDLEIFEFRRAVKIVDEKNQKPGESLGDRIPYASMKLRHARNKDGKIDERTRGRRYDVLFWNLKREEVRDELAQYYRHFGYSGDYIPKYAKEEFIDTEGKGKVARFYIGRYTEPKTNKERNSRPRLPDLKKVRKQETKDSAAAKDVEF